MIVSRDQNQLPSFFAPLGDLLQALVFLSSLNGFNSSPLPPDQGFVKRKSSSKVWTKNGSKGFCHFFLSSLRIFFFFFLHYLCVLLYYFESVQFFALHCLICFCLFSFQFWFIFFFHIKKIEKYKNNLCLCTLVLVYLAWPLK